MSEQHCEHCKFSRRIESGNDQYSCHRYPPQTHLIPQQNSISQQMQMGMQSVFPVVNYNHFCGEFVYTYDNKTLKETH